MLLTQHSKFNLEEEQRELGSAHPLANMSLHSMLANVRRATKKDE